MCPEEERKIADDAVMTLEVFKLGGASKNLCKITHKMKTNRT
jgi:hypothetical protein